MLDFAVNVWPAARPAWLDEALLSAIAGDRYPDERAATRAIARRHRRGQEEVLLLNGACEGFWLIAQTLRPLLAACVHPSFTEPELALRAAGTEIRRVYRERATWRLDEAAVPPDASVVVVGNPNNPTGTLEPAANLRCLLAPGRLLIVDESFIDFVPCERESLASDRRDGLVIIRSLSKVYGLAGVRAGYLLGPAPLVRRLRAGRQPWSVNALACAALAACAADTETPRRVAADVEVERQELAAALGALAAVRVWPSAANFLLLEVAQGSRLVREMAARGIAVRPARTFPGLGRDHVRIAVRRREDNRRLVRTLAAVIDA